MGAGGKVAAVLAVIVVLFFIGLIFWPDISSYLSPTSKPEVRFANYSTSRGFDWGSWWVINTDLTVTNQGDASATNVRIITRLYEGSTIRDSDTTYIGTLNPGMSYSISLTLDGDFLHTYRLWFEVNGNEGIFHRTQSGEFRLVPDINWLSVIATIVTLL